MRRVIFFAIIICVLAAISGVLFLFKDELRLQIVRVTLYEWIGIIFLTNVIFTAAIVSATHYYEKLKRNDDDESSKNIRS